MASDRKEIMTFTERLYRALRTCSQTCDRGLLAVIVSEDGTRGAAFALTDPNCVNFVYTPDPEVMLDFCLN